MGLFSFLEKPFRTGRTKAAKDAAKAAKAQQEQFDEFAEIFKPSIERGTAALKGLEQFSTADGLNDLYTSLQGSDLVETMTADRTRAVEGALASSGLRRSGTRLQEAANVPTEVLSGLMSQLIGNQQNVAQIGLGQGGNALGGLTGAFNASNAASQYAAMPGNNKASMFGGLLGLGGQLGAAGILASDERLKTNINKIGEIGPLNVYKWDWIDDRLGFVMSSGFIAQEVKEVFPEHVYEKSIEGFPMLGIDYKNLMEELKNVQ